MGSVVVAQTRLIPVGLDPQGRWVLFPSVYDPSLDSFPVGDAAGGIGAFNIEATHSNCVSHDIFRGQLLADGG